MVTSNGSSPLTVRGLDPGMMYSITINVFNGSQVVLRGKVERKTITVTNTTSSKICDSVTIHMYILQLCTAAIAMYVY